MHTKIKWKPFNSLINEKDIQEILKLRSKVQMPTISIDRIEEINYTLSTVVNNENKNIEVKYYDNFSLKTITGKLKLINRLEKYILVNSTRIYFKFIINIKLL